MKFFKNHCDSCNHSCNVAQECPLDKGAWWIHNYPAPPPPEKRAAKALRLAHDVLQRGTRRSLGGKIKRGWRTLWRFLWGRSPW